MRASELREKTVAELQTELQELFKNQFNYRMQMSTGKMAQFHLIGEVNRDIARVKTIITEKEKSGS